MTQEEINAELSEIRKNMRMFDAIICSDITTGESRVTKKQAGIVKRLLSLFHRMNWQISFNTHKELKTGEAQAIRPGLFGEKPGSPVKVRSCRKEHGDKTYFGILIGDVATGISHSEKDGVVTADMSMHNPAILIPELGEIVYGCESWWGEIESEEELDNLITDETINNVWYVKMLKAINPATEGPQKTKGTDQ